MIETAVFYKEDIADIMRCSLTTALQFIKESGYATKIGRRYAIPRGVLDTYVKTGKFGTPEHIVTNNLDKTKGAK